MEVDDFRTRLNCALRVIQREEANEEAKVEEPSLEDWEQDAARWVRVDDLELTATEAVVKKTQIVLNEAVRYFKANDNDDWFEPPAQPVPQEDVEMPAADQAEEFLEPEPVVTA